MSSTPGSTPQSAEPIRRAAVVTSSRREVIGDALERLRSTAQCAGVELVDETDPAPELAVVLGGDGTMLEGLKRFLGTGVPVVGVNFGTVGFLTSIRAEELEQGLARVYAGDFRVIELRTLAVEVGGARYAAVNDAVLRSSVLGRMVQLSWSLGDEDLGEVPCDGMICATPAGSTAYNLSNGGPVLVWGLEAMAVSFLAPHSLHARPIVVPRGLELEITNLTADVSATVLIDGRPFGEIEAAASVTVCVDEQASLLATLPEVTFFRRYRETFTHFRQAGPHGRP
jgi:NAD+ kinase